ncbi:MAG: NHL repeat-containing protein [Kiritimatiellae bacterium]|nr:NHL repeat-containing protein [Kiritimatiellia bacterium]MDD4341199.1 NHL repeat-containing protein [Kiritimatiellia bacterium]
MKRSGWIIGVGIVLLAGLAWGGLEGPQDAWYEVDAWHSWVEGETTNYLDRYICAMAIGPDERIYALAGNSNYVAVFEQDGAFVRKWGSPGSEDGQFNFNNSASLAFDATGRVYVADYNNDRIQVFESDGTFVTNWGQYGTEDGMFNDPRGIAVGPNGLVYVVDYNNYRVQVFEQNGTYINKFGGQGDLDGQFSYRYNPESIAIDSQELLYIGSKNYSTPRTDIFDLDGNFVRRIGNWTGPNSIFAEGLLFGDERIMTRDGVQIADVDVGWGDDAPMVVGTEPNTYFSRARSRSYVRDGVTHYDGTIIRLQRRYSQDPIEEWKAGIKPIPNPVILKFEQRPGHYVMDIDYVVKDADSATVMVELGALRDGRNRLDAYIPAKTFLEGTAGNVGDAVVPNVTNHVVWDITADVDYEYVNLRPAVMAHSTDRGLWDVEFITLPAEGELPELTISRNYYGNGSYVSRNLMPVWRWLAARGAAEGVELRTNGIYAVEGAYAGQPLAYDRYSWSHVSDDGDISVTSAGWNFLAARLGYRLATTEEKQRAYDGREWNNYLSSSSSSYPSFVKE